MGQAENELKSSAPLEHAPRQAFARLPQKCKRDKKETFFFAQASSTAFSGGFEPQSRERGSVDLGMRHHYKPLKNTTSFKFHVACSAVHFPLPPPTFCV